MKQRYKILSLVVSLKRYKKNSVIPNIPAYIIAKQLNIHPSTYKSLINQAIEMGVVQSKGDYLVVINFVKAFKIIFQDYDFFFKKRQILRQSGTDFKQIYSQILQFAVEDNIIAPQQKHIQNKQYFNILERIASSKGTDKRALNEWRAISPRKKASIVKHYRQCIQNGKQFSQDVVTSCRHTAETIGVSKYLANKTLNKNDLFSREIVVKWVKGISFVKIEQLKIAFPSATIIPCVKSNMIKVCFGSSLKLNAL